MIIGIDIGGSSVKYALFKNKGDIIKSEIMKYHYSKPSISDIINKLNFIRGECEPINIHNDYVVCGVPGSVSRGVVSTGDNIEGLNGFNIKEKLNEIFGFKTDKVTVIKDTELALLGAHGGHGNNVLMITLGTGIGSAFLDGNGEFLRGHNNNAGLIGHIKFGSSKICCCGQRGCLETLIGNKALIERAKSCIDKDIKDVKEIYNYAYDGNKDAIILFESMGEYLAHALSHTINILSPRKIYIGGGISGAFDFFIGTLKDTLKDLVLEETLKDLEIRKAPHGEMIGLYGSFYYYRETVLYGRG